MRKLGYLAAAVCGALTVAGGAFAASYYTVRVNNQVVDTGAQPPVLVNGHLLVPLAAISNAMGAYLEWRPATRTVYGRESGHEFHLPINSSTATVDGQVQTLETPARIFSGRTMVPLRFVATALGSDVRYMPETHTVRIRTAADAVEAPVPGRRARNDRRAPVITVVSPASGATVRRARVAIRADFAARGASGVDPSTARLVVNGVDVTRRATVTAGGIVYRARITPGPVTVRVTVDDRNGNTATKEWGFTVK